MARNDERPSDTQQPHEEDNPFIAFRRYADEQMAGLLQSFIGLPAAFSSPSSSSRWRPYDDEIRQRARDNWYASAQDDEGKSSRRMETAGEGSADTQSDSGTSETSRKKFVGGQTESTPTPEARVCPYRPVGRQPRSVFRPAQFLLPWPVNYMLYSAYSPYHLERGETTRAYGSRWRDAFEELLDYEAGETDSEERQRFSSAPSLSPLRPCNESSPVNLLDIMKQLRDWATERRLEPDAWFEELGSRQPEHDIGKDEMTELDLYERLLNREHSERTNHSSPPTNSLETATVTVPDAHALCNPPNRSESLGIISTLTSTERITMPDGTVHTKVVLKKRFADGREESSETMHTTQGGTQVKATNSAILERASSSTGSENARPDDKEAKLKSERKGWFWS